MFENLAEKGIIQQGHPDLITIHYYHPEVMEAKTNLDLYMSETLEITSGYRDHNVDKAVKNSPHKFAIALDLAAGNLENQIRWAEAAINMGVFKRVGLYPQRGIIHVDIADIDWCEQYGGTSYWVCIKDSYFGFNSWQQTIEFAQKGDKNARIGS